MQFDPATLSFNEAGLVPAVAQDAATGEVLMLAWMNAEAVRRTLETGRVTYWSRSRQAFWAKGETSGHVQELSRNFNLVSLAGVGLVTGNVWPAIGGSIFVAIYNGGPPGGQCLPQTSVRANKCRRVIRIHRCVHLLFLCCDKSGRAGQCNSIVSRSLSLGICDTR